MQQNDTIDLMNVLSVYSTDSVIKRANMARAFSIEHAYGDTSGTFELLITVRSNALPHTVVISADDIECSCAGFMHVFNCTKLCTHLVLCIKDLYTRKLLSLHDISEYLKNWRHRDECNN